MFYCVFMEDNLEVIIIRNLDKVKPYELKGFVNYDSISSLNFCAEMLSLFLKTDHNYSKKDILEFPFQYQNLSQEEIDLFKSRLNYYLKL